MTPEIVAEFTTNHMGHLGVALEMVCQAATTGADSIKMQAKHVDSFYRRNKLLSPFASPYGQTYAEYRRMFEFELPDWVRFDAECQIHQIPWFVTAQDRVSLRTMLALDCFRYKVASSNARDREFLEYVAREVPTCCEIVISVAGSTLEEIEWAINAFPVHRRIYVMHCVAEYPCPPERLRLGNIPELQKRFGSDRVRIGYSGHEEGYQATLAAVQMGAEMIERHFCLSRHSFVHHIECSLEPPEFATMVDAIRRNAEPKDLPDEAYESHFGMSEGERPFLVDQTYGQNFLGKRSTLGHDQ